MATISNGRGWASDACAASIHRADSAFGRILPITSAGRTYQEQADAYYRYKYQGGPLALPPGTSPHESGNAIDWGSSAWSVLGLYNGLWWNGAPINAHGFARDVSSETWHTPYFADRDQYAGGSPAGSGGPSILAVQQWLNAHRGAGLAEDGEDGPMTQAAVKAYQAVLGVEQDGVWGPGTEAAHVAYWQSGYAAYGGAPWIKAIQSKLNRLGYSLAEDGEDGPATQAAVKDFQSKYGLTVDGVAGPITNNKMDSLLSSAPVGGNQSGRQTVEVQKKLIEKGFDLGVWGADGDFGAATTAAVIAFQKSVGLTPDGIYGPQTDSKLFEVVVGTPPPATNDWPINGYNATTRLTKDVQAALIKAGFDLGSFGADGVYGKDTSIAVAKYQKSQSLDADGIYGPMTDGKLFKGVALPDAPADPTQDPLYGKKIPTYPGATWADVSPNKSTRTGKVQLFIVHHRADTGSAASARKRFMAANDRNVSPSWNLNQDASVDELVPPDDYRPWTTGAVDHQATTVETGNQTGEPTWGISMPQHEAIARLAAWNANRYKFPIQQAVVQLDAAGNNIVITPGVIAHRDTPAGKSTGTVCPGPSMNMAWIIQRAKDIFQAEYVEVKPPVVDPPPVVVPPVVTPPASQILVDIAFLENLKANQISDATAIQDVIDGK